MHKDKPPGMFDLPRRTAKHAAGLGLAMGVLLSAVMHLRLLIWHADAEQPTLPRLTFEDARKEMSKHLRPPKGATPAPASSVRY